MAAKEKEGSPRSSTNSPERVEKKGSVGGYGVSADAFPRDHLNAMFENPLAGIPREQLFADVDEFCNKHNLSDYNEVFRKGALVAQNPSGAQYLDILNQADKHILEREHTHKWSHPRQLYYLVSKYYGPCKKIPHTASRRIKPSHSLSQSHISPSRRRID